MDEVIIGDRGSGKTTYLIKKSSEEGSTIIVPNEYKKNLYLNIAKSLGIKIKTPIVYERGGPFELTELSATSSEYPSMKFIIDDVEDFLSTILKVPLSHISLSTPKDDLVSVDYKTLDVKYILRKAISEKEKQESLQTLLEEKEREEEAIKELGNMLWKREEEKQKRYQEYSKYRDPKIIPGGYDFDSWEKLGDPLLKASDIDVDSLWDEDNSETEDPTS